MNYIPISYKSENFYTLKTFSWVFKLDDQQQTLQLNCQKLTNKRLITLNQSPIFEGFKKYFKSFDYTFNYQSHILVVVNSKQSTDLIIDGISFHSLFNKRVERIHKQVEDSFPSHPIAKNEKLTDQPAAPERPNSLFTAEPNTLPPKPTKNYDFDSILT